MVELYNYFSHPIARIDGKSITDPYGRFYTLSLEK